MASSRPSRVHPPFKTKYRVTNWQEYDRALVQRGSLTFWVAPEAIAAWNAKPCGRRGAQPKFSDLAIETALTLRLLLRLPLRQTEGFLRSLFELMGLELEVPDHTTLSRRSLTLQAHSAARLPQGPYVLVLDSTGLSIVGQGQWAAAKHGNRGLRGWRKLHVAVDEFGQILHHELTSSTACDAHSGASAIHNAPGDLCCAIGDPAYDAGDVYAAAESRGAGTIIPPNKNASLERSRSPSRRAALQGIATLGRRPWRKASGYTRQARAENTIFRYKVTFGDRMHSRRFESQQTEATLAVNALNRMAQLGMPKSVAISK